mgnify:CR=1 FL=1
MLLLGGGVAGTDYRVQTTVHVTVELVGVTREPSYNTEYSSLDKINPSTCVVALGDDGGYGAGRGGGAAAHGTPR